MRIRPDSDPHHCIYLNLHVLYLPEVPAVVPLQVRQVPALKPSDRAVQGDQLYMAVCFWHLILFGFYILVFSISNKCGVFM